MEEDALEMENSLAAPKEIPKMKKVQLKMSDYMKKSLQQVAANEGFKDYNLILDHGSEMGDGFVGDIFRVTIEEVQNGEFLQVIVKVPSGNQTRRIEFKSMQLFEREIFIYNVLLPEFVKFQSENRIKPQDGFFNFPKIYFAEYNKELDDAIIIMEDLKVEGYRLHNKSDPIDYEHAKLVMSYLGRLHAISLAFKRRKASVFEEFKKFDDFLLQDFEKEKFFTYFLSIFDKAIASLPTGDQKSQTKMEHFKENLTEFLKLCRTQEMSEPYSVILHGDCWSNNLMFEYKNRRPQKIQFIDWQNAHYHSPVKDLVYFLFNCTDHAFRVKYFDELLQIYHNSLKALLNRLGGDVMKQLPQTALFRQLKFFGKYGILMSLVLLPIIATKKEDLPDLDYLSEALQNGDNEELGAIDLMFQNPKATSSYKARIKENILDACSYGYL